MSDLAKLITCLGYVIIGAIFILAGFYGANELEQPFAHILTFIGSLLVLAAPRAIK